MTIDFFNTRGFVSGGVIHNRQKKPLNIQSLPAFLRTLLVADGTVTKSLEAFFWEPVQVKLLSQSSVVLSQALPRISASIGTEVMQRDVQLKGQQSEIIYCYASSYIRLDSLSKPIAAKLVRGEIGIGELLREVGLETYREIVDIDQYDYLPEKYPSLPEVTNISEAIKIDVVTRVYVIHIRGEAAIQITERFPLATYTPKHK